MSDTKTILEQLHSEVAKQLLQRIQSGEAKAADFGQAINFLKNNGIDAEATEGSPLGELSGKLADILPFTGTDDTE